MIKVTEEMLAGAKNKNGTHSRAQRKLAIRRFDSIQSMAGETVDNNYWKSFYDKKDETKSTRRVARRLASQNQDKTWTAHKKKPKPNKTVINKISPNRGSDWSWKPTTEDMPAIKVISSKKSKNRGKNKAKRQKVSRFDNDTFYSSREWRELRARVLEKYQCKCMMCGRSPREHGIVIHCDHIKPRSKYPNLSLTFDNLQLLCEDCNLGKSNKYDTDWRPELDEREEIDALLDMELLEKGHYSDI